MKIKPVHIIGAVITMLVATACPQKEDGEKYVPIPDPYTIDTEEAVYKIVWNDLISPSFRTIELAEVFSGYQEIRSDREKALNYVESYFDNSNKSVYYEYMDVYHWGRIDLMSDGSFTVVPANRHRYWIHLNIGNKLAVSMPQAHTYEATSLSEKGAVWNISATIEDSVITMTNLEVHYEDYLWGKNDHLVKIEFVEPMTMPVCSDGKFKMEPVSGAVRIKYRSENAEKTFRVIYHEDGKTFRLPDSTEKDVEPETPRGGYEY